MSLERKAIKQRIHRLLECMTEAWWLFRYLLLHMYVHTDMYTYICMCVAHSVEAAGGLEAWWLGGLQA